MGAPTPVTYAAPSVSYVEAPAPVTYAAPAPMTYTAAPVTYAASATVAAPEPVVVEAAPALEAVPAPVAYAAAPAPVTYAAPTNSLPTAESMVAYPAGSVVYQTVHPPVTKTETVSVPAVTAKKVASKKSKKVSKNKSGCC